jgi:hypothetical protein
VSDAVAHSWMELALIALFDDVPDSDIDAALRSDDARAELKDQMNAAWSAEGANSSIPAGTYADNLFHGLLALRAKFDRQTALSKLALNLAMRNPPPRS